MKKKIIFIIFLVILIAVLFMIPKDTYMLIFGKGDDSINDESVMNENILVYMVNDEDNLVGVFAKVKSLEEDLISQKFDVLTKKTGAFKNEYDTFINTNTILLGYEVLDSVLVLNFSNDFFESYGRKTLEQLVWTYCDDEISEIKLKVDNNEIHSLNGFYFDKLDLDMGINLTLESNFLFESSVTTILEYCGDVIKPVSYVYQDMDVCDFIVSKLFNEIYANKEYDYVLSNDSLILDIAIDNSLSDDLKKSIVETISYNMNIKNIQIQGINQVLLEIKEEK